MEDRRRKNLNIHSLLSVGISNQEVKGNPVNDRSVKLNPDLKRSNYMV